MPIFFCRIIYFCLTMTQRNSLYHIIWVTWTVDFRWHKMSINSFFQREANYRMNMTGFLTLYLLIRIMILRGSHGEVLFLCSSSLTGDQSSRMGRCLCRLSPIELVLSKGKTKQTGSLLSHQIKGGCDKILLLCNGFSG